MNAGLPLRLTRRDLNLLFPALFAAKAAAETTDTAILPSACYSFETLPHKINPETGNESWQVFRGETHDGFKIACHITRLQPGYMPHPPHHHVNEEAFFICQGTLEVTIAGKTNRVGAGSVTYVHSEEMHGVKNVGDSPAQYFVLEFDGLAKA
jgi:mannose-6-phosphate isomerase-like protein (cupin superfamily)